MPPPRKIEQLLIDSAIRLDLPRVAEAMALCIDLRVHKDNELFDMAIGAFHLMTHSIQKKIPKTKLPPDYIAISNGPTIVIRNLKHDLITIPNIEKGPEVKIMHCSAKNIEQIVLSQTIDNKKRVDVIGRGIGDGSLILFDINTTIIDDNS